MPVLLSPYASLALQSTTSLQSSKLGQDALFQPALAAPCPAASLLKASSG